MHEAARQAIKVLWYLTQHQTGVIGEVTVIEDLKAPGSGLEAENEPSEDLTSHSKNCAE